MHGPFKQPEHDKGDANTIAGYAAVHGRPAAFEAADGFSYSVELVSEATGEKERPFGAYFLFVRWNQTASPVITGHLETGFLEYGSSMGEARDKLGAMNLASVREVLNQLVTAERGAAASRPWWEVMRDEHETNGHDSNRTGVITEGTGGVWRVRTQDGTMLEASLRGKIKKDSAASLKLAVGDEVLLERDERDVAWAIREILPRRSVLARRAPGGGMGERILVANLDQVVVVFAAASPEPHPRMLDRFLVIAEANDLSAILVINKVDLVDAGTAQQRFALYGEIGYELFFTSVKRGDDLDRLHKAIAGRTSALSGPSGVGKSSLLNAMYPGAHLRVGEISHSVNKGRHTTVGAKLLPLPDSGFVVDTPGLREIGLWGLEARYLDRCFPEMRELLEECRFKDCSHVAEPGCAVRDALHAGRIPVVRYDSYLKLRSELA